MKSFRRIAALLVIACLLVVGVSEIIAAPKVSIRYAIWGVPEQIESQKAMIAQFEKENPHIDVRIEISSWADYWTKLQTQTAGGSAPDVFLINGPSFIDYARKGLLLDVTRYIARDKVDLSLYPKAIVDLYMLNGKHYGLPRDFDTQAIYYNKTLFKAAGLAYPTDQMTWESMEQMARKLTKDTNGDGRMDQWGIDATNAIQPFVGPMLWANGGDIFNAEKTKCLLDSPVAVKWIQKMMDWKTKDQIAPSFSQGQALGWAPFLSGKIAMSAAGPNFMIVYKDIKEFEWDVIQMPLGSKGRATTIHGLSNVIYAKTKRPNEAWRLAKALSEDSAQKYLATSKTAIPALAKYAEEFFADIQAGNGQNAKEAFLGGLEYARMFPVAPNFNEWNNEFAQAFDAMSMGNVDVVNKLKELSAKITRIINRL